MTTASIAVGELPAPIPGQAGTLRPTRFTAAWLPELEGVAQLLGRAPTPADDLTAANEALARARAAAAQRPVFVPSDPVIEGDRSVLDAVAARPEVHADFPDVPWRLQMVDLTRVQAIQKFVFADELLPQTLAPDLQTLISICLPVGQPAPPLAISPAPDGFTMSSVSPNLRVASGQTYTTFAAPAPHLPPRQVQVVNFVIDTPTSYVQVARFQGRFFLRDGNHRAAGLLRAGITQVPAVVIEAPTYQYVTPQPGLFDYQVAFSDRPPLVTDFWNSSVAADGRQPRAHKGVHVGATQFPIPVYN